MPDTPRRRAPRGHGEQLRGEILRAAMACLAETGDEERMSLREVARRVGVSIPAIYLHFTDKQALVDAVCREVFEALHLRLREASASTPDAFEALRRQGIAYVQFALANPEHYRVVFMRRHAVADPGATDRAIVSGAFGHLLSTVEECVRAEVFAGDPAELALHLWSAVHGVAALLVAKPYFPWPPVEAFVDRAVRVAALGVMLGGADPAARPELTLDQWRDVAAAVRGEVDRRG